MNSCTSPHTHRRRAALAGGLLLSAALVAGCGGGTTDAGPAAHPRSPGTTPTGAIQDLTKLACHAVDGVWRADGTVANSDDKPHRYRVQLAVINKVTSSVLGEQDVTVAVPAGRSRPLHVRGIFKGRAPHASCAPRVTLAD